MTIADLDNAGFAYAYLLNEDCCMAKATQKVLAKFPLMKTYYEGLGEELKDHLESRPRCSC